MVNVPLFTNVILRDSAFDGGLNLARMTLGVPLGAILGGVVALRLGFSRTATAGAVLMGVGFLGMSRWDAEPSFVLFTLPLFAAGVGLGLIIAPVGAAVMNEVAEGRRATVYCLLTVIDLLGSLVGVALLTTRGLSGFYASAGLIPLDDPHYAELIKGLELGTFSDTFVVAALVCFAIALPAALLGRRGEQRGTDGTEGTRGTGRKGTDGSGSTPA
jgi:MFS family permease